MNESPPPKKKPLDAIDPASFGPLPFTDRDREDFARAVRRFNAGAYWEAHEAWEEIWRRHAEDSRIFLQGLIVAAAALHTLFDKGSHDGALRNFAKAIPRLALFEPAFAGVRVTALVGSLRACRDEVRRLGPDRLAEFDRSLVPQL